MVINADLNGYSGRRFLWPACMKRLFLAHTVCMRFYEKSGRWLQALWGAFCIVAVLLTLCQLLQISEDLWNHPWSSIAATFARQAEKMAPYLIAFALPYRLLPGSRTKCGVWSALSYGLFTALFTAVTKSEPGLLWPVLLGLAAVLCIGRAGEKQGMLLLPVLALSLAGVLGAVHGYYENALLWLLHKLGSSTAVSGVVFGLLNTLLRPLSGAFEQPVYLHSAGGAVWLGGQIFSGAKAIFAAKPDSLATALFLSGKGLQLFLLPGFALTLADCGKTCSKATLALFTAGCVLSGHTELFVIFLALESPFLLLAFAGLTGGCYLVSALLDLHWGFLQNGGIVEFLLHNSSGALPYLVGVTFCVLAYFVSRYTVVRYGIAEHSCVWLPEDLRPLVQELGGLQNILAIEEDGVQVRNSKRVNTLLLEGELKEDRFMTDDPQIQTLKEYLP